jgi:hypothetical protein
MAKLIDKLTRRQLAELPVIRDEWLAYGLSTQPADRTGAVEGVNDAYRAAGLELPAVVVWLRSPLEGVIGVEFVRQLLKNSSKEVWGQVGDQVRDQVRLALWGQHEAGYLSWFDTFRRFGLKCCDRMGGLIKVAQCAGWWWPMRGVVILTERPSELHRDEQGGLHSESGPAVLYRDGWGVWAIHGVRVSEQIVMRPESLTGGQIRDEPNAEVRRVMVERFGHERFIRESGARLVQEDDVGKLWRTEIDDDEPVVVVEVLNSTPEPDGSVRSYMLRVPPATRTAREGVAWTFDVPEDVYEPVVQT